MASSSVIASTPWFSTGPTRHPKTGCASAWTSTQGSNSKSLSRASLLLSCLFLSILRRRICLECRKQTPRNQRYLIDCGQKRSFVRLRRFGKAADFSNKLERRVANLFFRNRGIEVEQVFDIPAHRLTSKHRHLQP